MGVMKKYRITTNGNQFRIEEKVLRIFWLPVIGFIFNSYGHAKKNLDDLRNQ